MILSCQFEGDLQDDVLSFAFLFEDGIPVAETALFMAEFLGFQSFEVQNQTTHKSIFNLSPVCPDILHG